MTAIRQTTSIRQTQPKDRTEPAQQVFDTPELLEHILHYLPYQKIIHARLLNHRATTSVQSSKKLHQSIFSNTTEVLLNGDRCHRSWAKHHPAEAQHIFTLHPVLMKQEMNHRTTLWPYSLDLAFNTHELLKSGQKGHWRPDDLLAGGRGARLKRPAAFALEVSEPTIKTFADLTEALSVAKLKHNWTELPSRMVLMFEKTPQEHNIILDNDEGVLRAERRFDLPFRYGIWGNEREKVWQLRAAIEKVGREIYGMVDDSVRRKRMVGWKYRERKVAVLEGVWIGTEGLARRGKVVVLKGVCVGEKEERARRSKVAVLRFGKGREDGG